MTDGSRHPTLGAVRQMKRRGAIHIAARNSKPDFPPKFGILQNDHMTPVPCSLRIWLLVSLIAVLNPVSGQSPPSAQHTERPTPPTRNPNSPGYVKAKELPDGSNPPVNVDGLPPMFLPRCLSKTAYLGER
jgi:hypothetical protein